jgi:hypothetical protein
MRHEAAHEPDPGMTEPHVTPHPLAAPRSCVMPNQVIAATVRPATVRPTTDSAAGGRAMRLTAMDDAGVATGGYAVARRGACRASREQTADDNYQQSRATATEQHHDLLRGCSIDRPILRQPGQLAWSSVALRPRLTTGMPFVGTMPFG